MKKTILAALVAVLSIISVSAQTYVGGSVSFWHNGDTETTSFSLTPEVGYNLNEKWAVGAELDFAYVGVDGNSAAGFGIAPYARYTYFNEGKFSLFVDGGLGINKVKNTDLGFQIGFQPGFAVKLTDQFSLVSKFGFLGYSDMGNYGGMNGFGFAFANNVSFGFYVNF